MRIPCLLCPRPEVKFDVQKNMWNAIFDFSGEVGRSHWRILPLEEASSRSQGESLV